jgi:predicted small metal-binding protein
MWQCPRCLRIQADEMSARKRIRAVECMDCDAVLSAEDEAALVDALGKHYVDAHRRVPMTEDKIREQVSAQARAADRR